MALWWWSLSYYGTDGWFGAGGWTVSLDRLVVKELMVVPLAGMNYMVVTEFDGRDGWRR